MRTYKGSLISKTTTYSTGGCYSCSRTTARQTKHTRNTHNFYLRNLILNGWVSRGGHNFCKSCISNSYQPETYKDKPVVKKIVTYVARCGKKTCSMVLNRVQNLVLLRGWLDTYLKSDMGAFGVDALYCYQCARDIRRAKELKRIKEEIYHAD